MRIETVTRDIKTQDADGGTQVVMVQDGKIRMNNPRDGNGMIVKNSVLYVIDDKRKTYSELDKATMKKTADQAGAAMAQMQEQPEEHAARATRADGKDAGRQHARRDERQAGHLRNERHGQERNRPKAANAASGTCIKNGVLHEELCVVPYSSLPGKEDFEKAFKELAESAIGMAGNLPGATAAIEARKSVNGFPVRVR